MSKKSYRKNDVPGVLPVSVQQRAFAGERIVNSAVRCPVAQHESFRVPQSRTSYPYQIRFWFGSYAPVPEQTQSSDCFLPASGNRNNYDGLSNTVGTNGNYWLSVTSGSNGVNMNFNTSNVNAANSNNTWRASGYTVRCVQAFTPFFLSTLQKAERFSGTAQDLRIV